MVQKVPTIPKIVRFYFAPIFNHTWEKRLKKMHYSSVLDISCPKVFFLKEFNYWCVCSLKDSGFDRH